MNVVIIDYGAGNVRSVQFALERLGIMAVTSGDAETIKKADRIIFPGVGEAATAMRELNNKGLTDLIPNLQQPVLGICLGMQLLCRHSEEGNTKALGVFPMDVVAFSCAEKIPHMGWNTLADLRSPLFKGLNDSAYVYFVHSYYVPINEYTIAQSSYPSAFSAALQKDNFYACQFHPEKSADIGAQILGNFLALR